MQNARRLCLTIHQLCKRGKSNLQIAGDAKVQRYALAIGVDVSGEDSIRAIKRDPGFLMVIGHLDKFKAMIVRGDSDQKIAKKLGREYEGYLLYRCYDAEDIHSMKQSIFTNM